MATPTNEPASTIAPPPAAQDPTKLNFDELGDANRRAQIDGIASGAAAAFLAGQISTRLLKQGRNAGLLSGLIYLMTGHSLSIYLHQAQQSRLALRARLAESSSSGSPADGTSPEQAWDLNRHEGGVGGMEVMTDKYRSTSGDH
ncbi:BZ3500_MvSof-1268-A1-R1_Chr1-1g01074 [Microbotryum saponariae]|uniref:BZ3500_MvSof-1268-A1-R1_Chr1-1g01074 protein n=1 Tax=Microbotryum saponariae TaxID=289078 RepID=A0A2X0KIW8_9BASI|nr:BZ3500_MvSof-1268-A1-R1_Chr1-1g01074 [Microbotryum saponariae]SCZ93359.1 BZ3501_MvSof-1269-A2-R1_Chr1-1g00671 [Microbotryum saponariae]